MSNNHVCDAPGNGRVAPFLISNSQVTEESLSRAPLVLRTFKLLGRCSASIACCIFVFILAMSSAARLSAQTAGSVSGHVADRDGRGDSECERRTEECGYRRGTLHGHHRLGRLHISRRSAGNLQDSGDAPGIQDRDERKRGSAGAAIAAPGLHDAGRSGDAQRSRWKRQALFFRWRTPHSAL